MKREDLKKMGLTDEQIDLVMAENGKDIEKHKAAAEASKTEIDGLRGQLAEAAKAIEGFKGMDIEGVKKSADEWKAKAEQAQRDAETQVASLKFEHALDQALVGAKARNAKAVRALLSTDGLKLQEDGTILGLKEQLEKIRADNDFLFEGDKQDPKIVAHTDGKPTPDDPIIKAARAAAGLSDPK